jgi:hypothetical protein
LKWCSNHHKQESRITTGLRETQKNQVRETKEINAHQDEGHARNTIF